MICVCLSWFHVYANQGKKIFSKQFIAIIQAYSTHRFGQYGNINTRNDCVATIESNARTLSTYIYLYEEKKLTLCLN